MGLTALLAACRESDDDVPRFCAAMNIGGRSLIEYQAHVVRDAGADTFIIYVERVTAELRQAIERLQHAGFRVKVARSVTEAIDHVHPADRLLMIADGMVVSPDIVNRLVGYPGNAVATLADAPDREEFELIDSLARWAGIAVVDAGHLTAIRTMPEDWDVHSTLLRSAIQAGINQLPIDDMIPPAGKAVLHLVAEEDGLAGVDSRLLLRRPMASDREDWICRHVYGRLGQIAGPALLRHGISGHWLLFGALILHLLSIGLLAGARPAAGLALLLLAGPIYALAMMLGTVRHERAWAFRHRGEIRPVLDGAALLALSWGLMTEGQGWGQLVFALLALLHAVYLRLSPSGRLVESHAHPLMRPGADMMAWLAALLALIGMGAWAPGVIALWLVAVYMRRQVFPSRGD